MIILQQTQSLLEEVDFLAATSNLTAYINQLLPNINWAGFYFVKNGELVLGPFQGKMACTHIPFEKGVCGKCYREKRLLNVPNVLAVQDHIACDSDSRSELCVPIMKDNECIGMIDIDAPIENRFTEEDEKKVSLIASLYEKAVQKHHWF
ncbi:MULTISPECIES: GAF domain-containing protein [Terrabacteria group]|uniref:GAF domain-containing protein n=1 Tax=Bacillati TaxID=1783272 RepID=UPI001C6DEBA3|nr:MULTISPECIES: GAF domain-containing protein [Terrabacteria group]MBW9212806.1 GAF domain-containing protein [Trueperella sp. zg.1013]